MHELEIGFGLLAAVLALAAVASRIAVPYPILLVLGGLALAFVPGMPRVELEPALVFLLFLPPILFSAAYATSWRDFKANARPIGLLAVGLVIFTTVAVAVVARWAVPGLGWPEAFVLGAIVSPPDAVATTAIMSRLGVPRRVVTVLEGESLVNDATALVALRFATAAVVTGAFSLTEAGFQFVLVAVGGILIGIVAGVVLVWLLQRIDDVAVNIGLTLLAPLGAYLGAERLHVSGVLAAVVAGLIMGRRSSTTLRAFGRLEGRAVWTFIVFVINGLVFVLIGLQLLEVVESLGDRPPGVLVGAAVAVCLTTILVRIAWVFPATYLPRRLVPGLAERDPAPPWQPVAVISWAGLRGVVSLAAALALPLRTDAGDPFPNRDMILFLTFCVILATLVGQGLSLPWLIRRLGISDDGSVEREEVLARRATAEAAIRYLDDVAQEPWVPDDLVAGLRQAYAHSLDRHLAPTAADGDGDEDDHEGVHARLRGELLATERRALVAMRDRGEISDEAMRRVERDLDLVEERRGF
jgi:CPA1 family monovalent cation:H+ antiporter